MGLFDRLRDMPLFRKAAPPAARPQLVLRWSERDQWAAQLAEHASIATTFREHTQNIARLKSELERAARELTSEAALQKIPERARTTNAVHGNEYAAQVRKLLERTQFSSPQLFESEHETFSRTLENFRESTTKSASALGEFMGPQLERARSLVAALEDDVLKLLEQLEEKKSSQLTRLQQAQTALAEFEGQQGKFSQLREALAAEQELTRQKCTQIEQKIREQRALIRNPVALEALEKLGTLEQELDQIVAPYEAMCKDAKKYLSKAGLAASKDALVVLERLPKDTARFLIESTMQTRTALEALAEQIEQEGSGKIGNLPNRIRTLAQRVEQDATRIGNLMPQQSALRKDIIRDVAALNIYDQQQFLLRAQREDREIGAKLAYVDEQQSGARRIEFEREMKDAAIAMNAIIAGEEFTQEPVSAPTEVEAEPAAPEEEEVQESPKTIEDAQAAADASIGEAENLLREVEEELRSAHN